MFVWCPVESAATTDPTFFFEIGRNTVFLPRSVLVTEVAFARKDHHDAAFVGRSDHFVVANRAARLDHAGGTLVNDDVKTVAEREERIGAKRYISCLGKPCLLLLFCKYRRLLGEYSLPLARDKPDSAALMAAMRAESTRLIWPAPTPSVIPSCA